MPPDFHQAVKRAGKVRTELRHVSFSAVLVGLPITIFLEGSVYLFPTFPCSAAVILGAAALCIVKPGNDKERFLLAVVVVTSLVALFFQMSEWN